MIRSYDEACDYLERVGRGTVRIKDGRTFAGPLMDVESKWDDPEGVGNLSIRTSERGGVMISASEFECLLEEGEVLEEGEEG